MNVGLDKPVQEENINEPGGMEKFVWAAMQISTLHHSSSWERNYAPWIKIQTNLSGTGLMPAKKQVMSKRFKLASGVCEVQADGFVIFMMIMS